MKYRKASPAMRMLLSARDEVIEGSAPLTGFLQKAAIQPLERRLLVLLEGSDPPDEFPGREWVRLGGRLWSVKMTPSEAQTLAGLDRTIYFEEASRLAPAVCTSAAEINLRDEDKDSDGERERPTGAGVIVGIIDNGIDIRHRDFLDATGKTRIKYLWDQNGVASGDRRPPEGYREGVEYSEVDIDRILRGEEAALDLSQAGHGTHVAAIAAGTGDFGGHGGCTKSHRGVAPQADIIFVALTHDNTVTLTDSYALIQAIRYIFAKADAAGCACVINISLAQNLGSHDGESLVEHTIDEFLQEEPGRAIVIAAGNENENYTHASGRLEEGQTATIRLKNVPLHASSQETSIQIWYSSRDRIAVSLRCPDKHQSSPVIEPDVAYKHNPACGAYADIDSIQFMPLNGDSCISIRIDPGKAAGGEWLVELAGSKIRDGVWHAWVERSAPTPSGEVHQPHFVGTGTEEKTTTLSTPSTARRSITVGNYSHLQETRGVFSTSGRGPTRDGREKPEITAPGHLIWSALAGGPDAAARCQRTGTSMSAPHVTGLVALMFEKNRQLTARQIQNVLRSSADPADEQQSRFDNGWGFGRLNARRALELTPPIKDRAI